MGSRAEDPAAALRRDPETKWAAGSQGAPRARGMSGLDLRVAGGPAFPASPPPA